MAVRSVNGDNIEKVANAIRTKGGTSGTLSFPNAMANAIASLKGPSKCVSKLVEDLSYNGEYSISMSIGNIKKIQAISIVATNSTDVSDNTDMILMLTILMDSDASNVLACSCTSRNHSSRRCWHYDLNSANFPSVTINGTTVTVNTSGSGLDEFAYDYRCTVYGL